MQAGTDQSIEWPTDSLELQGSATDAAGSTLTYAWSVESGPGGVTFGTATAATTSARFPEAGAYALRLTVSDGSLSGTDSVNVTVNPAVYPMADVETDPDHGWARITPVQARMDETKLASARDYALTGGGSGVIVRNGRLVYSWGDIDQRIDVKSTTKSIGGIALGLALDENRIALADLAQSRLPGIGNPPVTNDPNQLDDITVLNLATHTAGFEKPGGYGALIFQPGTTWLYSDGALNWLADLLTNVYSRDLAVLLQERVFSVLGITNDDLRWRVNQFRPGPHPSGIEHREFASGITINTNAMARIGLLFLREGVWGNQRLLAESFVDTVRTPRAGIASVVNPDAANFPAAPLNYGVLWWTNSTGALPTVPRDAYWAWGKGDSLIVVIPSLDLVIARAGNSDSGPVWRADWNGDYSALSPFLAPIVESVAP